MYIICILVLDYNISVKCVFVCTKTYPNNLQFYKFDVSSKGAVYIMSIL